MTASEFGSAVLHRTAQRLIAKVAAHVGDPDQIYLVRDRETARLAAEVVNEIISSGVRVTAAMLWDVPLRFTMPEDPQAVVSHVAAWPPWELSPRDGQIHLVVMFTTTAA